MYGIGMKQGRGKEEREEREVWDKKGREVGGWRDKEGIRIRIENQSSLKWRISVITNYSKKKAAVNE